MARLAFDTGGTFTDFALHRRRRHPASAQGAEHAGKPGGGRGAGRRRTARCAPAACSRSKDKLQILGATTVVTNAVLERKGVETAFITTDGFQDMLRIRTEGRYDLYDLKHHISRSAGAARQLLWRRRAHGRGRRRHHAARREQRWRSSSRKLRSAGHQLGRRLPAACLQVSRSTSSASARCWPRPDRSFRVAVLRGLPGGARVRPRLDDGRQRLHPAADGAACRPPRSASSPARGSSGQVLWMTSSGGVVPSATASRTPVRLIESGPPPARSRPPSMRASVGRGERACPSTWAAPPPSSA